MEVDLMKSGLHNPSSIFLLKIHNIDQDVSKRFETQTKCPSRVNLTSRANKTIKIIFSGHLVDILTKVKQLNFRSSKI